MKIQKQIFLVALISLLVSCGSQQRTNYTQNIVNGVTITTNKNTPSDSTFKIKLLDSVCIKSGFSNISCVDLDSFGNVYVLDNTLCSIKKFNTDGLNLYTFGRLGQGPGEFEATEKIVIESDTVYVPDFISLKVAKFDLNGKFLSYKTYRDFDKFPAFPESNGKYYLNSSVITGADEAKNNLNYVVIANQFDKHLNFIKEICRTENSSKFNELNLNNPVNAVAIANDNKIYIGDYNPDHYEIKIKDLNDKEVGVIRKHYSKVKFSEQFLTNELMRNKEYGFTALKGEFKNSITKIQIDKSNRLWVNSAVSENNYFDVFENSIYLNRVKIPASSKCLISFKRGKLIVVNQNTGEVKIYSYE